MKTKHELVEIMNFITEYATVQLGAGVHTSRVARNSHRMGEALDVDIRMLTFQKNAIMSIQTDDEEPITRVVPIPTLPISFIMNSNLSSLSWDAYDEKLTLEEIRERFNKIITKQPRNMLSVTLCVGLANGAFCRLFGGDVLAMAIVFAATVLGFALKNWLTQQKVLNYLVIVISSFVASASASLAINFDCTANIAIATSPLFLVPGVPLINGFIDIMEGYVLIGISRLVNALLLIVCIAIGLSCTLMIIKNQLL